MQAKHTRRDLSIGTPSESWESSASVRFPERCYKGGYLPPLGHRVCLLGPPVAPPRAEPVLEGAEPHLAVAKPPSGWLEDGSATAKKWLIFWLENGCFRQHKRCSGLISPKQSLHGWKLGLPNLSPA